MVRREERLRRVSVDEGGLLAAEEWRCFDSEVADQRSGKWVEGEFCRKLMREDGGS